jgi:ribose transport system ATP-binding protein
VLRLSHRIAVMCEGRLTGFLPGGAATTQEDIMRLATMRPDLTQAVTETEGAAR